MEIILKLKLDEKEVEKETGEKWSDEKIKDELVDMLFEVCENWVLHNQQPDFDFK